MIKGTAFDDDLPTVQVPVGAKDHGLTIDGRFTPLRELPSRAQVAYLRFIKHRGRDVYQCVNCGYLTTSRRVGKYRGYTCSNCGKQLTRYGEDYVKVHGDGTLEENYVDIPNAGPEDFPNTEAHLTRIKRKVEKGLTMSEMLREVAGAVKEQRENSVPMKALEKQEGFVRSSKGKDIAPMVVYCKDGRILPAVFEEPFCRSKIRGALEKTSDLDPDWAAFLTTAYMKEMRSGEPASYRYGDLSGDLEAMEVHLVHIWTPRGRLVAGYDKVTGERLFVEEDPEGYLTFPKPE